MTPSEERDERMSKDISSIAFILQSEDFTVLRRLITGVFLLLAIDFGLRLFIWIIAFLRFVADQGY